MNKPSFRRTLLIKGRTATSAAVVIATIAIPVLAAAASQNFNVLNDSSKPGMLVSLTANSGVIEQASSKNASSLIGVISGDEASLDKLPGQRSVKTEGETSALISTINGDIKVGDRISPSSLVGVGAKSIKSGWVVGVAQGSLDAKTAGAVSSVVRDSKGDKHKVQIARVPVVVKIAYYTVPDSTEKADTPVPDKVQSYADALAGKHASPLAVIASFIILLTGIIVSGIVISSTLKNGFTAISRQPLTKHFIFPKMMQSFGITILLLIVVAAGALAVLKIL